MSKEFYCRIHDREVYLYVAFDNKDEISFILSEKEASDLSTQLGFAVQDIDRVRTER